MFRAAPFVYDLKEHDHIWLRPWEDLLFSTDFGEDVSGRTFKVLYEEYQWPYMMGHVDTIKPGQIEGIFTFETNDLGVEGAVMKFKIDNSIIKSWTDRRIDFKVQVTDGTSTWICADKTVAVVEGD